MQMTTEEFEAQSECNAGYCRNCDMVTNPDGVEPDAEGYECEECGEDAVMGLENALVEGLIELEDNDEENEDEVDDCLDEEPAEEP